MEPNVNESANDTAALEAMLAEIPGTESTPTVGPMETTETAVPGATPVDMEEALALLETEHAAAQASDEAVVEAPVVEPTMTPANPEPAPAAPVSAKPEGKKAKTKAEKEAAKKAAKEKREAEKKEREAAKAATPPAPKKERIFFGSRKVERMKHEFSEAGFHALCILTKTDAALTGADREKRIKEVESVIGSMSDKVKNRATYLLTFCHRGSGKLNEVIRRAFEVLNRDGHIKTGDAGNLHAHLLAKPYDAKTARATGNNTVAMLKQLQVIVPGTDPKDAKAKGYYVANPDSIILEKVNASLASK